jgi:hypothetical protein
MRTKMKLGFEHLHQAQPRRQPRPLTAEERAQRAAYFAKDRYRLMVFDKPITGWGSLREAQLMAIRGGHGCVCESTGRLYMTVPAWLQHRRED